MGSKGSVEGRAERITGPVVGRVKTLNRFRRWITERTLRGRVMKAQR